MPGFFGGYGKSELHSHTEALYSGCLRPHVLNPLENRLDQFLTGNLIFSMAPLFCSMKHAIMNDVDNGNKISWLCLSTMKKH